MACLVSLLLISLILRLYAVEIDPRPLFVFFDWQVDVSSWKTILKALKGNLVTAYVAFERNDYAPIVALSYRWDYDANSYADSEDWDSNLVQLQYRHSFQLRDHPHVNRLKELVSLYQKLWVDQHCVSQIFGRMGSLLLYAPVFHGYVVGSFLTKESVDRAFASGREMSLLGNLNEWLGRGWVQQEVTARGYLVNLNAFEYFLQRASKSNNRGLESGALSLCLLLRRMKGAPVEPLADRIVRFYDVCEAAFTVESDRDISLPDFSDVGYESFRIGSQPVGYVLQPEIAVSGDRVNMENSNGVNIGKWFKYKALYCKGFERNGKRVCGSH